MRCSAFNGLLRKQGALPARPAPNLTQADAPAESYCTSLLVTTSSHEIMRWQGAVSRCYAQRMAEAGSRSAGKWAVARFWAAERDDAELLTLASPRSDAERLDAALAAALEQIRAPAFVLSECGEIREANSAGLERLAENAPSVAAALLESARDNDGEPTFHVTPLRAGSKVVGYLAIERLSPARLLSLKEQRVLQAARRWSLTRRQAQVLSLVAEGSTNARVAAQLGISERTAEDHVAAILERASAASRSALIAVLLGDFG